MSRDSDAYHLCRQVKFLLTSFIGAVLLFPPQPQLPAHMRPGEHFTCDCLPPLPQLLINSNNKSSEVVGGSFKFKSDYLSHQLMLTGSIRP